MPTKTNAARALDALGVVYELLEYDFDPDDLSAETVAAKIGLPPEQTFKTLVLRTDKNAILLAVVPGDQELDLRALGRAAGVKNATPVAVKELPGLTGYVRGGVTALALKKPFPVFADETMILFPKISVSAGMRGLQILLSPDDYVRATSATLAPLARDKPPTQKNGLG